MRVGPAFVSYRCGCCMALIGPDKDYCDAHDTAPARLKYRIWNWYYWRKRRITLWFKRVILKDPQAIALRESEIKLSKMFVRVGVAAVPRGSVFNDFSMMKPPDDAVYFIDRKSKENLCNEIPLIQAASDEHEARRNKSNPPEDEGNDCGFGAEIQRGIDAQRGIDLWEKTQEDIDSHKKDHIEKIRQLRSETSQGILHCKKALEENDWHYEKAKAWILENPRSIAPPLRLRDDLVKDLEEQQKEYREFLLDHLKDIEAAVKVNLFKDVHINMHTPAGSDIPGHHQVSYAFTVWVKDKNG